MSASMRGAPMILRMLTDHLFKIDVERERPGVPWLASANVEGPINY